MSRWRAAAAHLVLSIVVIGGIALAAFLVWYPHAIYRIAGLDRILLVMLAIDLTAGPLLTLIIYRTGKWGLRFDLLAIALCQAAFLCYGLHTLWKGRPVFLVATPDSYTLVFAHEVGTAHLASEGQPGWNRLPWAGPALVGARMPDDPNQRREAMDAFMAGGPGIERSPRRYLPFEVVSPDLLRSAVELPPSIPKTEVQRTGLDRDSLRTVPVMSRRGEGLMLIDATDARPLRAVN